MTRSPAIRQTRQPNNAGDLCASLKRIAIHSAAGFVVLILVVALFWK